MLRHRLAPGIQALVGRADAKADAVARRRTAGAEARYAPTADLPGEFVGIPRERVVFRLQPEAWQLARPAAGSHERQVTRQLLDPGRLVPHADPLHGVVGADEHVGEAAVAGHAPHGHRLRPERLLHAAKHRRRVAAHRLLPGEKLLQARKPARRGVDRTDDTAGPALVGRPQGHHEILESEERPTAAFPHGGAGRIDDRKVRRPHEQDVPLLRHHDDVRDPL